jgi:hypothetical protein
MNRSVYLDNWIYFFDATLFPAYLGFAIEVPLFSTAQEDMAQARDFPLHLQKVPRWRATL